MGFKPFKWIKNHPFEAAAIAATAYFGGPALMGALEGGAGAAGAAGAGAAGWVPAEGGAGYLGGMAADSALLSPITAATAGSSLLGGLNSTVPEMMTPGITDYFAGGSKAIPDIVGSDWSAGVTSAMKSNIKPGMKWEDAMLLGKMAGLGQPQQQPHLGGPIDMSNPYQRPAMATQDAITKKWLLQNDPATYARLYGQPPQGVV